METEIELIPGGLQPPTEKKIRMIRSPSPGFRGRSQTPIRGRSMTPLQRFREKSATPTAFRSITPFICREDKEKTPFEIGSNIILNLASYKAIIDKALVMDISMEEEPPSKYIISEQSVIDRAAVMDISNVEYIYVEEDYDEDTDSQRDSESRESSVMEEKTHEGTPLSGDEEQPEKKKKTKKTKKVTKKKTDKKEKEDTPPKLKLDMGPEKPKVSKAKMFEQSQNAAKEEPRDKPPPKKKAGKLTGALAAMQAEEEKQKEAELQKQQIEEKMKKMKAEQEAKKQQSAEEKQSANEGEDEEAGGEAEEGGGGSDDEHGSGSEHGSDDGGSGSGSGSGSGGSEDGSGGEEHDESGEEEGEDEKQESSSSEDDFTRPNEDEIGLWMIMADDAQGIIPSKYERKKFKKMTERERDIAFQKAREAARVPRIHSHLKDCAIEEGHNVKLTCTATGPELNIKWYRNGIPIEKSPKHRLLVNEGIISLEIVRALPDESGEYTCSLKNNNGEANTSAIVTIFDVIKDDPIPPTFASARDYYHLNEDVLGIEVHCHGTPRPKISWIKDGFELKPSFKYTLLEEAHGVYKLEIYKPAAKDSGKYTCKAENKVDTAEIVHNVQFVKPKHFHLPGIHQAHSGVLKEKEEIARRAMEDARKAKEEYEARRAGQIPPRVREEPPANVAQKDRLKFATQLRDRTSLVGNKMKFSVSVIGPDPNIRWFKDETPLQYGPLIRNATAEGLSVVEMMRLSTEQTGQYRCVARNNFSEIVTSCYLKVYDALCEGDQEAPLFVLSIRDNYHAQENDLIIDCKVRANPRPEIVWLKDEMPIEFDERTQQIEHSDGVCELIINKPTIKDSGNYSCCARNNIGSQKVQHRVEFVPLPGSRRDSGMPPVEKKTEAEKKEDEEDAKDDKSATGKGSKGGPRKPPSSKAAVETQSRHAASLPTVEELLKASRNKLHFVTHLKNCVYPEQARVKLSCIVHGPDPNIRWLKDDNPVVYSPRVKNLSKDGLCILEVNLCTLDDSGVYTCCARNAESDISCSCTLQVYETKTTADLLPTFTRALKDTYQLNANELYLETHVRAVPKAVIEWFKDSVKVEHDDKKYLQVDHPDGTCELVVNYPKTQDSGKYVCQATNSVGQSEITHYVLYEGKEAHIAENIHGVFHADHNRLERAKSEGRGLGDVSDVGGDGGNVDSEDTEKEEKGKRGKGRGGRGGGSGSAGKTDSSNATATAIVTVPKKEPREPKKGIHFAAKLTDRVVAEGSKVKLTCYLEGADPAIKWFKDDNPVVFSPKCKQSANNGLCTLEFTQVTESDSGNYKCFARNLSGEVNTTAKLEVYASTGSSDVPPTFTRSLKETFHTNIQELNVSCHVRGLPTPTITWTKDGVTIEPSDKYQQIDHADGSCELNISYPTHQDSGKYVCQAENRIGKAEIAHFIQIEFKETRSSSLVSTKELEAINEGTNVTAEDQNEEKAEVVTKGKKKGKQESSGGGSGGGRRSAAPPPDPKQNLHFIAFLTDRTVAEGGKTKLSCYIEGPDPNVRWMKDDNPLQQSPRCRAALKDGLVTLDISALVPDDSGEYKIIARNGAGEISCASHLNVYAIIKEDVSAPIFTNSIKDSYQIHSNQLIIECKLHDKSNSSIKWLKDNVPIEPDKKYSLIEHENGTKQLIISNPTRMDNGLYSCHGIRAIDHMHIESISHYVDISDKLGIDKIEGVSPQNQKQSTKDKGAISKRKLTNSNIEEDIETIEQPKSKVRLETHLKNVNIDEGGTIELFCNVKGSILEVKWFYNNKTLSIDDDPTKYNSSINENGTIQLEIFDCTSKDSGEYSCSIRNSRNEVFTTSTVNVYDKLSKEYIPPMAFTSSIKESYDSKQNELILDCYVRSRLPKCTWFKDNQNDIILSNKRYSIDDTVTGRKRLIIKNPVSCDFGRFICRAEDEYQIDTICIDIKDMNFMIRSQFVNDQQNYSECKAHIKTSETVNDQKDYDNNDTLLKYEYTTKEYNVRHASGGLHRDAKRKPQFTTELMDRRVTENSSIKLTCNILGIDTHVQWLKNSKPLTLTTRHRKQFHDGLATLEILGVLPDDNAEYTCVAKNEYGEQSSSSYLKVFPGYEKCPMSPIFTRSIKDTYNLSANEIVLECRVRGQPQPSIQWTKDGEYIGNGDKYQQFDQADGCCKLIVTNAEEKDSGLYVCQAENSVSGDKISHSVEFVGKDAYILERTHGFFHRDPNKPHFRNTLGDHLVTAGGTIALQAEILHGPVDVQWLREKEPIVLNDKVRSIYDHGIHTLILPDATAELSGTYTCRAANAFGKVESVAHVHIVGPSVKGGKCPLFISRPETDMKIMTGDPFSISFRVIGDPKPKLVFMKGLRDITQNDRTLKEAHDDYIRFSVQRSQPTDSGTYCVLARNQHGTDRAFVTILVKQRARSITPTSYWSQPIEDIIDVSYLKNPPGPISTEPILVNSGRNHISLQWDKPSKHIDAAPVLSYRIDAWEIGPNGGARWVELGKTPINTFDAFNLKSGCQYHIRVTPRNRYGWGPATQTTYPIQIAGDHCLPEFTKILPGQLKALINNDIQLECIAKGVPKPIVLWYKNGIELKSRDERISIRTLSSICRLTIKNVIESDSGRYTCEATNNLGRVSTFARLQVVNEPKIFEADRNLKRTMENDMGTHGDMLPHFTMRLRDRRIQATYPVRLTCQAIGWPTPDITWYKDGNEIDNESGRYISWNDGQFNTIEISKTNLQDCGRYTATAKNELGSVSCHCTLVVDKGIRAYIAPEFYCELDSLYIIKEYHDIRMSAQIEAYPTVGITWQRDGLPLRPSRRIITTLDHDGFVELTIANATKCDAGIYTCVASNAVGRVESNTRLIIEESEIDNVHNKKIPEIRRPDLPYSKEPLFITKPRSSQAYEGDTVIIYCEVVGNPKPDVLWLRDFLNPDYYKDAPHFRRVGDGPEYRLEIPRAKLDFTGTYSVIAKNCHGETKAIISLQIYAKDLNKTGKMDRGGSIKHGNVETHPMFTRHLKDLRCCDGDAIKLECHVEGIPEPMIFWEKDGRILPHIIDFVTNFDGERATLAIEHVFPEDEGEYTCVASNNIGRAYSSACIIVDVPEEKENLVSRQLTRPSGILSPNSTPRSTPRTTPIRSISPMPLSYRSTSIDISPKRHKCAAPKFYAVPHSRVAEEGETVRFQCAIAGHPMPWSTWDKDGMIVTPSTRITCKERDDLRILEIEEVTYEDAGLYRITLENDYGRIEATARLDIIANKRRSGERSGVRTSASPRRNISCSRRLMGNSTRIGGRLALACNFRGTSAPVRKFYHNGEEIIQNDRITVNCNDPIKSELFIDNVQWGDQGEYTCIAENEYGMAATSTIIQLNNENDSGNNINNNNNKNNNNNDTDNTIICMDIPEFIRGIGNKILWTEGKPLDLECEMQCSIPYDIQWFKDDQIIMDSDEFSYIDHGNGMLALRISDPFGFDTGEYTCLITTDYGNCKTTCMVQIDEYSQVDNVVNVNNNIFITTKLPVFQKYPETVVALYGSVVSICAQIHPPDAEVKWNVCGRDVTDNARGILIENRNNGTKLIHILGLEHKHSGEIKCSVYYPNTNDIAITSYSDLVVLPASSQATTSTFDFNNDHSGEQPDIPAYIIRGPEDCTALIGGTIILETLFGGYPQPKVKWLQAGRVIAESENIKLNISNGRTTLLLTNITADQSGKYSVEIMNEHSNDIVSASVAVEGPPEPPGGRPSVSQGPDRIAVAWCGPPYDGGCMITGFILEMQDITNGQWIEIATVVNSLAYTIKNLQPGLTYRFRVRAENIHGRSEPSQSSEDVLIVLGSAIITNNKAINTSHYINSNNYMNMNTNHNNNNNHNYNKNNVIHNINGYDEDDNDDYNDEDDDNNDDTNAKLEKHIYIKPGGDFKTRFQLHEELGKGRFGIVYKCTENDTGQILAAKIVKCIKSKDKVKIQEEISIMQSLKHPKLLQLAAAFESPREIVMVMEYITGGELFERVVADDFTLTEHDCILFLRQICEGVDYMHSKSVVHLDLKPENIMCHTRTSHQIKIIDFGLAQRLTSNLPVRVLFGTPEFIPPEIISYEPIGFQSDMWSVGVICYVLLSGLSPFMGDSDVDTFSNITRADYDFDDEAFDAVSQDAKDFISNLLIHRKESRLSAEQCLKSNWLSQHNERNSNKIKLCTDKLKKFIIRRKWQKTGNAIRALGRMATLSANSRRNSIQSSLASPSPRPSISGGMNHSRMPPLNEQDAKSVSKDSVLSSTVGSSSVINRKSDQIGRIKEKICSERSDSGFSECSNCSGNTPCVCNNSSGGNHPITGIMDKIDLTIVEEPMNKIISNNNDLDTKLHQQNILISDLEKLSIVENTNHNFFEPTENITEEPQNYSNTGTVTHTEEILNRIKSRSSSLDRKSVEKDLIMKSDFTNTIQMRKQSLETNALKEKKIKQQPQPVYQLQKTVEPIGKVSILKQRFSSENIELQKSPSPPPQSNTTQFENLQQIKSLSKPSSPLLPPRSRRSNKSPVFTRSLSNDTTATSGSTSTSSTLNQSSIVSNSEKNSLDKNNQNRMEVKNVFDRLSVTTNNNNNNNNSHNRSNANNIHNYMSNDNKIKTNLAYTNDSKTTIASASNSTAASATFSLPFSRTPIRLSGRVKEVTERLSSPKNYVKSTTVLSTLNNNNQNRNDVSASIKNDNFNKVTAFWKS